MARRTYDNAVGRLGSALASGGTTIDFGSAPSFATLAGGDYIPLVLEPAGSSASPNLEIVYLTAYTAGQTTGTILRGREGTAAVAHASGATWLCGPTSGGSALQAIAPQRGLAIPAFIPMHGYWPLQEAAGAASAVDLVNAVNLTNNGGTFGLLGPTGDAADRAVSLPAGDYLVSSVNPSAIAFGSSAPGNDLIAFWLYPTAFPATTDHWLVIGNTSVGGMAIDVMSTGHLQVVGIGGGAVQSAATLALNTWVRVAVCMNGGLWLNGVKDANAFTGFTPNALTSTCRLVVGGSWGGSVVASATSARVAKLAAYPTQMVSTVSNPDAARVALADYFVHSALIGA